MDFSRLNFLRVAAAAPELALSEPERNGQRIAAELERCRREGVALALFPELALTGYSCEDLFFSEDLLAGSRRAMARLASACSGIVAVIGAPWQLADGRLLNVAVVLGDGRILGVVPKGAPPNYGEFYERRWFAPGGDVEETGDGDYLIGQRQLFELGSIRFAVEICEDLWAPRPPGTEHALAGAELIVNPSASNELVAKAEYRRDLVRMASARNLCGYLYAGSGASESTKDVVYGGHLLAAENGVMLAEGERFSLAGTRLVTEFDVTRLRHDRMQNSTFSNATRRGGYARVSSTTALPALDHLERRVDPHPFVPEDEALFDARAAEILSIQATGLARRVLAARTETLVIGISGGLDSTLALLVCLEAAAKLDRSAECIQAVTMPGPGTSTHTLTSARELCRTAGVPLREISIAPAVAQHLEDLAHEDEADVVFENAQARERTQILFNLANKLGGIVVGTGDLSELALGWCTYNADHMANYNVNAGVPKTMVGYLVRWYARHRADEDLAAVLERVLDTPISPELLAPSEGAIAQETEAIIGPYELHDFFLYETVRNGAGVARTFALARVAFADRYDAAEIGRWLGVFLTRFYSQQFKRTTLPPGPKVGSVSLSPRGDWRMPDEATVTASLENLEALVADAVKGQD